MLNKIYLYQKKHYNPVKIKIIMKNCQKYSLLKKQRFHFRNKNKINNFRNKSRKLMKNKNLKNKHLAI